MAELTDRIKSEALITLQIYQSEEYGSGEGLGDHRNNKCKYEGWQQGQQEIDRVKRVLFGMGD